MNNNDPSMIGGDEPAPDGFHKVGHIMPGSLLNIMAELMFLRAAFADLNDRIHESHRLGEAAEESELNDRPTVAATMRSKAEKMDGETMKMLSGIVRAMAMSRIPNERLELIAVMPQELRNQLASMVHVQIMQAAVEIIGETTAASMLESAKIATSRMEGWLREEEREKVDKVDMGALSEVMEGIMQRMMSEQPPSEDKPNAA